MSLVHELAQSTWLSQKKYDSLQTISKIYNIVGSSERDEKELNALTDTQCLAKLLWPEFKETSIDDHTLLIVLSILSLPDSVRWGMSVFFFHFFFTIY